MNTHVTHYKTRTIGNWRIDIDIVDWCQGSPWLSDLYTSSDTHIAGTTVQVPSHLQNRHCPKFYIGQTTPSELASSFAKQGRDNPSEEAYASLQQQLEHYILASDCAIRCSVHKCGVKLGESYGVSFDYSHIYHDEYSDMAKVMLKEHGLDFMYEATKEAREVEVLLAA